MVFFNSKKIFANFGAFLLDVFVFVEHNPWNCYVCNNTKQKATTVYRNVVSLKRKKKKKNLREIPTRKSEDFWKLPGVLVYRSCWGRHLALKWTSFTWTLTKWFFGASLQLEDDETLLALLVLLVEDDTWLTPFWGGWLLSIWKYKIWLLY